MIVVTSASKADAFEGLLDPKRDVVLAVPDTHPLLMPVLLVVPLQLLAYHVAICLGADVDQPRNLAKSVTVE
jgi:glutamine---fructose-6-phosphate transaminase (isomerizing)